VCLTKPENRTVATPKAGARWISWLFGLAILAAVALFVAHRSAEQELARLVVHAQPAWLLLALRLSVHPALVFASFMLSTLARTLGPVPGGLGIFEAASVASLKLAGVPIAAGLAATLLFRGLSYWLPMAPGILLARRETRT
jgi:Mg2+-importing ATPase